MSGAAFTLPRQDNAPDAVLVTEGAEDGLTLWAATGQSVLVVFGLGFANAPVPNGAEVIIVADRDAAHDNSLMLARKAAKAFSERGCQVSIAMPPDGVKDSNELLVARGANAVRAMVAAAVP